LPAPASLMDGNNHTRFNSNFGETNMGITRRYFFVNDDDSLRAITVIRINKLYDFAPDVFFQDLAGMKVRMIVAWIKTENRRLIAITSVEGSYLVFDSAGRVSREWWDQQSHQAMNRFAESMFRGLNKKVVYASTRFQDQKEKWVWNVPGNMLDQILNLLRLPWQGYD
jgi:hypothetical protein